MAKYLKQDCVQGFVEDSHEIEYLKINNMRHTILGFMLGNFNENGEYVVDQEIVKELISLKKHIVESIDNIDICVSELKLDKQISFLVTFEGERATLSLIEHLSYEANYKTDSGKYSNINEYVLDEVETSGVVDKTYFYKRWNISEDEGSQLSVFDMDEETKAALFGIVNKFKYNLAANSLLLEKEEELEEIEAEYSLEILTILEKYPALKKVVLEEIKKSVSETPDLIRIDKPNFAKTINEVIENAIAENIDVLAEEKENFLAEQRDAKQHYAVNVQEKLDIVEISEQKGVALSKKMPVLNLHETEHQDLNSLADKLNETEKKTEDRLQNDSIARFTKRVVVPAIASKLVRAVLGELDEDKNPVKSNRNKLFDVISNSGVDLEVVAIGKETKDKVDEVKATLAPPKETKKVAVPSKTATATKPAPAPATKSAAKKKPAAKKPAAKKEEKKKAAAPKAEPAKAPAKKPAPTPSTDWERLLPKVGKRKKEEDKKEEKVKQTIETQQPKKTTKAYGSALAVTEGDREEILTANLQVKKSARTRVEPLVSGGTKVELPKSKDLKQVEKGNVDLLEVSDLTNNP